MLPRPEEADELIAHLAALVAARGPGPLVSGVIVEPTSRYFPDPWSPTMEGVERLARRLLVYAGLADLEVVIADEPRPTDWASARACSEPSTCPYGPPGSMAS